MIIIFDTETTGLPKHPKVDVDQQPRIIEFGAAVYAPVNGDWARIREYNVLINPGFAISDEITKITGITNEQLAGQPRFVELWDEIAEQFEGTSFVMAHNLPFDRSMLAFEIQRMARARGDALSIGEAMESFKEWPATGEVCTAQMFQHHWGRRPRLVDLYEWSIGTELAQTHRALDDVNALAAVLIKEKVFGELTA